MMGSSLGQQQALVGRLSDAQLTQELQSPSGVAPAYLLMSEIQKRQSMRADAGPVTAPKPNIRQQMLAQTQAQQQPAQAGPVLSTGVNSPPSQMPVTQRGPQVPLTAPLNPNLAPFSSAPGPHPLPGYAMGGLVQHFDNGGGVQPVNSGNPYAGIPDAYMPLIASGRMSAADVDNLIRTTAGEAANQSPTGQQAVAAVALNRSRMTGAPVSTIVQAPMQFDGYNSGSLAIDPNSSTYQKVATNILPAVMSGKDPTNGATSFFNPDIANPGSFPFDPSKGQRIGQHVFAQTNPNGSWTAQGNGVPGTVQYQQAQSLALPDPSQAAQNAGAIMQQYMSKAPPVQGLDQNIANVQGQVSDPSGAYGNLTKTLQNQIAYQGQMGKWNALMQAGAAMMQAKGSNMLSGLGAGLEAGGASYQQAQANQRALQLALANAQVGQAQEHSRYQQGNVQNAMELGKLQSQQQAPYLQTGDTAAKVYGQVEGEDIGAQTARQQHADMMQIYSGRMAQSGQNADTRSLAGLNDAYTKSASALDAKTPAGMARTAAIAQQIAAISSGAGVPQGAQTGAVNGGGGVPVNSADPFGIRSQK